MRIAILDDYQSVALTMADWSPFEGRAEISVFTDHVVDQEALAKRLAPFDILRVMRERTPSRRHLLEQLPKLKLIASTGPINAAGAVAAAEEHGVEIVHTGYSSTYRTFYGDTVRNIVDWLDRSEPDARAPDARPTA